MSRVYNFIFGETVNNIIYDIIKREILEDEFIVYYNYFQFLIENKNIVTEKELKLLGFILGKAKVKTLKPEITEKINEFKENYKRPQKKY